MEVSYSFKHYYDTEIIMAVKSFIVHSLGSLICKLSWLVYPTIHRHQDTYLNDIQHNDTQHKGLFFRINDMQHNNLSLYWMSLCWVPHFIYCYVECHYAECHNAECHCAECIGTHEFLGKSSKSTINIKFKLWPTDFLIIYN